MWLVAPVTELFILKGLPVLRDLPLIGKLPGVRGLARVSDIDFPRQDRQILCSVADKNCAAFFLPNHPECFTDWMIDKYILSRTSPTAACWADGSVVNGMGTLMRRFWLYNNLIAQIPGQSVSGRRYSVNAAVAGHGVLLHPEGRVNWFNNRISPLYSGAAEMAIESHRSGSADNPDFRTWLAPIVWKYRFNADVKSRLINECRYVENRLGLQNDASNCAAARIYSVYHQLAVRDYRKIARSGSPDTDFHLSELRNLIVDKSSRRLADTISHAGHDSHEITRAAGSWLRRQSAVHTSYRLVKHSLRLCRRWVGLSTDAFVAKTITQEEIAEHLKRVRTEFCQGTLRDSINLYLPQAAGNRSVHIRAVNPLAIHDLLHHDDRPDPAGIMDTVRQHMQQKLDGLVAALEQKSPAISVRNPFYPD